MSPRCDHRYKLVGYRYRDPDGFEYTSTGQTIVQVAVLVCLRCTAEHTTQVVTLPVPEYIQKREGDCESS